MVVVKNTQEEIKNKMAHFAELDENNIVINVISVNNNVIDNLPFPESEEIGINFIKTISHFANSNTTWKQTSYNHNFRKRYAGIGCTYNADLDAFILPRPFASWVLNNETADWEAPIPQPTPQSPDEEYFWDEQTLNWVLIANDE